MLHLKDFFFLVFLVWLQFLRVIPMGVVKNGVLNAIL